jgi:hypothetical protein
MYTELCQILQLSPNCHIVYRIVYKIFWMAYPEVKSWVRHCEQRLVWWVRGGGGAGHVLGRASGTDVWRARRRRDARPHGLDWHWQGCLRCRCVVAWGTDVLYVLEGHKCTTRCCRCTYSTLEKKRQAPFPNHDLVCPEISFEKSSKSKPLMVLRCWVFLLILELGNVLTSTGYQCPLELGILFKPMPRLLLHFAADLCYALRLLECSSVMCQGACCALGCNRGERDRMRPRRARRNRAPTPSRPVDHGPWSGVDRSRTAATSGLCGAPHPCYAPTATAPRCGPAPTLAGPPTPSSAMSPMNI